MEEPVHILDRNASVLGRLLEELSWAGATIREYRNGGRGFENILTAEALQGLDFLPRHAFLGNVLKAAHGADFARHKLIEEIESARFTLLPGDQYLIPSGKYHQTKLSVQPDGIIESPSCFVVVEAKRIKNSSFQAEQLSREYVLTLRDAGGRTPLLLLILGSEPPVKITKHGRLSLHEAVSLFLDAVLRRAEQHSIHTAHALSMISEVICWITWQEISKIVTYQRTSGTIADLSLKSCINRLADSVTRAIAWHGS